MARTTGKSFKDVRRSLYTALITHAYIPMVDIDGLVTEDVERRFFPEGTAEKVLTSEALTRLFTTISSTEHTSNLRLQPSELAKLVESRKLHVFLAILITSNCDLDGFSAFTTNLLAPDPWNNLTGELQLPTEDGNRLQDILEDDVAADNFLQKQHEFFAAVIEKNKEIKGRFRRLPYVREKLIGQGSFGKIYDVSISPHHFKSGPMLNEGEYRIARKDFELNAEEKSHEKERDVLRDIVRNAKSHNNIMKSLGSLENGSIYSLFMPLAACDLKQYMQRNPAAPSLPQQKASLVHCAVGLAGAIAYLHEELESPMYEKLSCFHMDLKPQNILIVIDPESQEPSWKLSDFNMSRVKMKRKPFVDQLSLRRSSTFSDNVYEINKLFKRRIPDVASASSADYTIGRRGTGTYLAPEACVDGHPVQAESDTWSLGCVISVVFSYLHGGQAAVEEYSELRGKKDGVDRFFSFSGGNGQHKLSDVHVSEAVKNWHKHLRMKTRQERPNESEAFEALLSFLDRRVLVIDPKARRETTANDIRSKLIEAFDVFHNLEERGPTSPVSPGSRFNIPILKRWSKRRQSEAEAQSQDWKIPLSTAVKTCAFGPNAEPLVCMTDITLTVYSLEHVLLPNGSSSFNKDLIVYGEVSPQDKRRHWIPNIGVSSRYIVTATDYKEFDCYFYQITQPGNHNSEVELVAHWELKMPRIQKLAISPDARYVAFVLFGGFTQKEKCSLYITKLDLHYDADQESKYISIASSSSGSSTSPNSPLGRPIDLPCAAEDVCELTFSDVNGLYVVTKPKQHDEMTENTMHVYAWSVQNSGRTPLAPSPIKHDGKDDILQGLYTCFAPYNHDMAFIVVSQEKRVVIRAWEFERYTQSNARGFRLLKILMNKDDHETLAFGTREAHNELQLLTFLTAETRDELKIKSGKKLPGMTHQSKFVPCINTSLTGTLAQRHLLIAVMEGFAVRIVRVDFDT
ncbi:hypothetical protein HBI56_087650 [Parastagonospora nodorum]|nr:hypothetical protein HBI78_085010 [Parastagonospora nodorum]KAH5138952.1 hypothetical protein HBH70_098610 [Parastagonospora nodorum]KAH5190511.1 hypothetical protein HBH77_158140 [Parastagonospora nodorum]KAH5266978.1 hypothetical protein HBI72_080850 [Parastagonospora nodorum]KAH5305691.1 hypothetical protein HBI12_168130 [Parastagonospora nodorum]